MQLDTGVVSPRYTKGRNRDKTGPLALLVVDSARDVAALVTLPSNLENARRAAMFCKF